MTVGELIDELGKYDRDIPVATMTHLEGMTSTEVVVELDEYGDSRLLVIFAE